MRRETVTIPVPHGIDWKGIGYLFSIVGALLLGAHAWPKPGDAPWHLPALLAGVTTTIVGFVVRYVAHLRQKKEIEQAKREAESR
jgi:predicted phage tail protein